MVPQGFVYARRQLDIAERAIAQVVNVHQQSQRPPIALRTLSTALASPLSSIHPATRPDELSALFKHASTEVASGQGVDTKRTRDRMSFKRSSNATEMSI